MEKEEDEVHVSVHRSPSSVSREGEEVLVEPVDEDIPVSASSMSFSLNSCKKLSQVYANEPTLMSTVIGT